MTIKVKNVEYWEWNVPEELVQLALDSNLSPQDLVDEYFNTTDLSVAEDGDVYYKAYEVL